MRASVCLHSRCRLAAASRACSSAKNVLWPKLSMRRRYMESQQPRNRLREKCGYVYGSIRNITGERPDVYASGRTDAERGVIEGWLTWQVGHAEGRALPAAGPWG